MKYKFLAVAVFLLAIAAISAILANMLPEFANHLNDLSLGCGVVAIACLGVFVSMDTKDVLGL